MAPPSPQGILCFKLDRYGPLDWKRRTEGARAHFRPEASRANLYPLGSNATRVMNSKEASIASRNSWPRPLRCRSYHKMGAFYLGGLAIECALKACIAKKTRRYEFPRDRRNVERVYSHDLSELLKLAGFEDELDQHSKNNPNLATNWGVVKSWNVDSRYEASGLRGF